MKTSEALRAWGAYDRDDPFPLFAAVRQLGAVHEVTLADGHNAWLVVGYEEARTALNDPRLSKDMHAALATGSWPRAYQDRLSRGTCSASTRRTTAGYAALSRPPSRRAASRRSARGYKPSSTTSSTRSPP